MFNYCRIIVLFFLLLSSCDTDHAPLHTGSLLYKGNLYHFGIDWENEYKPYGDCIIRFSRSSGDVIREMIIDDKVCWSYYNDGSGSSSGSSSDSSSDSSLFVDGSKTGFISFKPTDSTLYGFDEPYKYTDSSDTTYVSVAVGGKTTINIKINVIGDQYAGFKAHIRGNSSAISFDSENAGFSDSLAMVINLDAGNSVTLYAYSLSNDSFLQIYGYNTDGDSTLLSGSLSGDSTQNKEPVLHIIPFAPAKIDSVNIYVEDLNDFGNVSAQETLIKEGINDILKQAVTSVDTVNISAITDRIVQKQNGIYEWDLNMDGYLNIHLYEKYGTQKEFVYLINRLPFSNWSVDIYEIPVMYTWVSLGGAVDSDTLRLLFNKDKAPVPDEKLLVQRKTGTTVYDTVTVKDVVWLGKDEYDNEHGFIITTDSLDTTYAEGCSILRFEHNYEGGASQTLNFVFMNTFEESIITHELVHTPLFGALGHVVEPADIGDNTEYDTLNLMMPHSMKDTQLRMRSIVDTKRGKINQWKEINL